jgi:hypothetical protein
MLKGVADDVLVHESEFIQSNSTVVLGREGVLLVDPGITESELARMGDDLRELGQRVEAGFSTHPDWDHVLWHERFGDVPATAPSSPPRPSAGCCRAMTGVLVWQTPCRPSTPTRFRWSCSATSSVCPPAPR